MSISSLVTYLVTRSFTLCTSPSFTFCIYFSTTTLSSSNISPTDNNQQPTLLSPPASDLTLNSTPDHVLVHLGHLPDDLVLHLVHLLVLQLVHLYVQDLNNINHFPNNFQKQYYHHRQKLRP